MPDEDNVTLGELGRRFDRLEQNLETRFKAIDDRLSTQIVTRDFYQVRYEGMIARLAELESQRRTDQTWRRSLAMGVVVAFLSGGGAIVASIIH